mgnify:CR=1 FL=1
MDFFIPRFCTVCKIKLDTSNKFVCENCEIKIQFLSEEQIHSEFLRKFNSVNIIDDYTSLYIFEEKGSLQKLVHALKYENKFKIGIFLGKKLGNNKSEIFNSWDADFIIPVPLFNLKKVERGFNQSFYISKGINQVTNLPIKKNIIKRTKNTISQTTLTLEERKENLHEAFTLTNKKLVQNKKIIVIDDVITTGATVIEIAKRLKENGADKVFTASIATPPVSHFVRSSDTQDC